MEQLARLQKTLKVALYNISLIIHIATTYVPKMTEFRPGASEAVDVAGREGYDAL